MSDELTAIANDLDSFVHDMREDGNDASASWLEQRASALRRLAAAGEQKPVALAHVRSEDDGLCANLEVLDGTNLQPSMSPVALYAATQPAPGWDEEAVARALHAVDCAEADRDRALDRLPPINKWADPWSPSGKHQLNALMRRAKVFIEALRSSQSTSNAGGGVRVKPLEWHQHPDGETKRYEGIAAIGSNYTVFPAWWGAQNKWGWVGNGEFHHSDVEARSACNADYKERVLSALSNPAAADVCKYRPEYDCRSGFNPCRCIAPVARHSIEFDGFTGTVIGSYTTLEGKEGVVLQQDGTRVVHVYGRKHLKPAPVDANASEEARLREHKWFDPECQEKGCQSLVWKGLYEAAVKGRADFRDALREQRDRAARLREALEVSGGAFDKLKADITAWVDAGRGE